MIDSIRLLSYFLFIYLFILVRDPDYCTRYYRCSHGIDEVFECPRGTAWDETTSSCAWVDQVDCGEKKLGYSTSTTTEGMI